MSIEKKTTLAYMCGVCGEYACFSINTFAFSGVKKQTLTCTCGGSRLEITKNANKTFKVEMHCPVCSEKHAFTIPQSQFWGKGPFIYACPNYEANLLFIGADGLVEDSVREYVERELQMMKMDPPTPEEEAAFLLWMARAIRMLEATRDKFFICDCEKQDLTMAFNDKGVYFICQTCKTCDFLPLYRLNDTLLAITPSYLQDD